MENGDFDPQTEMVVIKIVRNFNKVKYSLTSLGQPNYISWYDYETKKIVFIYDK